ncbi:exosome complex component Rrp4 [Rhodnius prolixus]
MEESQKKKPIVQIRLANERIPMRNPSDSPRNLFTPGEILTDEPGLLRGHGTFVENEEIKSSLAGILERVNKLILVRPLKARYNGEIGDLVIGRVTEIQQKRWKVDANSRLDSALLLASVNLPGGELRRRSVEDERMMRQYLSEGDLISAEVQNLFSDGVLSLHTRNLKYGKLSQGLFVSVPPSLIKRCKTHFHTICGASLIIGTNGYIWICPTSTTTEEGTGGFARNLDLVVGPTEREAIARIHCCIMILAECRMLIYDTSIVAAHEASLNYSVHELMTPEVKLEIAIGAQMKLQSGLS